MKEESGSVPLHAQVIQMAMAYWISRPIYVCAKLGIADQLAGGAKDTDELARHCGVHAGALYRVLRALASAGMFTEVSARRFALTPMGETLKTGAPGAARSTVMTMAGDWMWETWGQFEHAVKTGEPGAEKALGMGIFDYFSKHQDEAAWFNDAMIGFHGAEPAAVAKAYDFSGLGTLVDVGGGTGNLVAAILKATPRLKGVLYDLPHVVGPARDRLAGLGLAERCAVAPGSFFESVPAGDGYVMSHVLHDWDDEECLKILGNCRRASPKAKVMIVEMVIPPGDGPHMGKLLDLMMLNAPGGMERTQQEFGALLKRAGYRLTRVVGTESAVSVVEGAPE
jgi:hypothetical protein